MGRTKNKFNRSIRVALRLNTVEQVALQFLATREEKTPSEIIQDALRDYFATQEFAGAPIYQKKRGAKGRYYNPDDYWSTEILEAAEETFQDRLRRGE